LFIRFEAARAECHTGRLSARDVDGPVDNLLVNGRPLPAELVGFKHSSSVTFANRRQFAVERRNSKSRKAEGAILEEDMLFILLNNVSPS